MRKAQGMSLNVIIIAALGLLVLVVLAIIFTGRTGVFVREVEKCAGTCVELREDCIGPYSKIVTQACDLDGDGKWTTKVEDGYCCVTVTPQ